MAFVLIFATPEVLGAGLVSDEVVELAAGSMTEAGGDERGTSSLSGDLSEAGGDGRGTPGWGDGHL